MNNRIYNTNKKPVSKGILKKCRCNKTPGPDGKGIWMNNNVGIAHRRLSVIDLSNAGSQPMSSKDVNVYSHIWRTYNYRT